MAGSTPSTQSIVKEAVLAHFARRIAEAIYQWDRRNPEARLDDLTPALRAEYEQTGVMAARMSEKDAVRAACYAAADTMVIGGIAQLKPQHRGAAVGVFLRGFKAFQQHLMRQAHPDERDLMAVLSKVDEAAGIHTQPVNTKPSLNLADAETPEGVM